MPALRDGAETLKGNKDQAMNARQSDRPYVNTRMCFFSSKLPFDCIYLCLSCSSDTQVSFLKCLPELCSSLFFLNEEKYNGLEVHERIIIYLAPTTMSVLHKTISASCKIICTG